MSQEDTVTLTMAQANRMREDCNHKIELQKCLERLMHNQDFKKLFLEEYIEHEPTRLVHLLAEPSFIMSDKKDMYLTDIKEQMIGIARFSAYIRMVAMLAAQAQKTLDDINQAEVAD